MQISHLGILPRKRFDYLVIGGGTSGLTLARHLAEMDIDVSVCVLEQGNVPSQLHSPVVASLLTYGQYPMFRSVSRVFPMSPTEAVDNRRIKFIAPSVAGGSSVFDSGVFSRGPLRPWRDANVPYWSEKEVASAFDRLDAKKYFTYRRNRSHTALNRIFLEATQRSGSPNAVDEEGSTGARHANVIDGDKQASGYFPLATDAQGRWNSRRLLASARHLPNLFLGVEAEVAQLITHNGRVARVQTKEGIVIDVNRECIVCAGAAQTAPLLQRSGIISQELSRGLGLTMSTLSPVCGYGLMGTVGYDVVLSTENYAPNLNITVTNMSQTMEDIKLWFTRKEGMFATPTEVGSFWHSDPSNDSGVPNIKITLIPIPVIDRMRSFATYDGFTLRVTLTRPRSFGGVALSEGHNPAALPSIDPNYLNDPADVDALVKSFDIVRRMLNSGPFAEVRPIIRFPDSGELPKNVAEAKAFLRKHADSHFALAGSCKMGVDPWTSVIDPTMGVHGLKGLRVAGRAMLPDLFSGDLTLPSMMTGMRCAEFMMTDLAYDRAEKYRKEAIEKANTENE